MTVFLWSFALLNLLAVAYAAANCPKEDGEYAVTVGNPADCRTFYICDKGNAILQKCPGDLEYNSVLGVCDWAKSAGCIIVEGDEEQTERDDRGDDEESTDIGVSTTGAEDDVSGGTGAID